MKKYNLAIFIFFITLFCSITAHSENFSFSIEDINRLALKNNLDISIEIINPEVREKEIQVGKAEFDLDFEIGFSAKQDVTPSASAFASPTVGRTETQQWDIGISQKVLFGGTYNLKYSNERLKSNSSFAGLNPQYTPNLLFSLTQPLLKDFGKAVNEKSIKIAQNNKLISEHQFKEKVIDVIANAQKAYWDLVFRIKDLKVKEASLALARKLEDRMKAYVEAGTMAPIEILQAKAEVASREEGVILASNEVINAEDILKNILNLIESPSEETKPITPTDPPSFVEKSISLDISLKDAFENRPDLKKAKIELKNRKIDIKYTENQLYPSIDLKGTFGLNGLTGSSKASTNLTTGTTSLSNFGGSYGDGVDRMMRGDHYEWELGVTFSVPIGNRAAKSRHSNATLEKEKQILILKNLEQKIALEVRKAVRKTTTDIKRIHATTVSKQLAEEKLKAEESRFEVGLSTSFNVLEYQRDLEEEQSKEVKAKSDYQKSLIELQKVTAVILERNSIKLDSLL